jgi:glutathione S-transferase
MRLHDYAASGNCYKVRLLLALLDVPYERVPVDIFAGDTLTDDYARLNPVRETPVLELDSGETIAQSNAILLYLADGTRYLPEPALDRARVAQWLFFEQERVMPGIGGTRFRRLTGRVDASDTARFAAGADALRLLDDHLRSRRFLVGEGLTVADISLFAYTHVAPDIGHDFHDYPGVAAWLERIRAEPGFLNDYVPYPENARPGASRSIYDSD